MVLKYNNAKDHGNGNAATTMKGKDMNLQHSKAEGSDNYNEDIIRMRKEIYDLSMRGEEEQAVALCQTEPYAADIYCQHFMGWLYYNKNEYQLAADWFSKGLQKGDSESMFGIGCVNMMLKEYEKALDFFEKSAVNGLTNSFYWIGYMYNFGLGMDRDYERARIWYKCSAAQGYLIADLGLINLDFEQGSFFGKIWCIPRLFYFMLKKSLLMLRNSNDPRLFDFKAFSSKRYHILGGSNNS